jgi:dipeptide/tripeptide permease
MNTEEALTKSRDDLISYGILMVVGLVALVASASGLVANFPYPKMMPFVASMSGLGASLLVVVVGLGLFMEEWDRRKFIPLLVATGRYP